MRRPADDPSDARVGKSQMYEPILALVEFAQHGRLVDDAGPAS